MIERSIRVELIDSNPYQTRRVFDDEKIEGLAASIKSVGLLNKVMVRPHPETVGRFQLVHGERRLRACRMLGWETIPAVVRDLSDAQVAEMNLTENLQRQNLNPIEEAEGFQILIDRFGYTRTTLADRVGKSRPYVSNSLRLLKMDFFLKACVLCQTITVWHALTIMGLPEAYEYYLLADIVIDWNLTVAETRKIVNDIKSGKKWIGWIRDVPILGLVEVESFRQQLPKRSESELLSLLHSMERVGQIEPIFVAVTGIIIDGFNRIDVAKKLGWSTIKAEVLFDVDLLRKDALSTVPTTQNGVKDTPSRGIFPELSEAQRMNVRKLVQLLRRREAPS